MGMEQHAYMEYREGTSDKFYNIHLVQHGDAGWQVECEYGRRGVYTPNRYVMPKIPVNFAVAEQLFVEHLKKKQKKGYQLC